MNFSIAIKNLASVGTDNNSKGSFYKENCQILKNIFKVKTNSKKTTFSYEKSILEFGDKEVDFYSIISIFGAQKALILLNFASQSEDIIKLLCLKFSILCAESLLYLIDDDTLLSSTKDSIDAAKKILAYSECGTVTNDIIFYGKKCGKDTYKNAMQLTESKAYVARASMCAAVAAGYMLTSDRYIDDEMKDNFSITKMALDVASYDPIKKYQGSILKSLLY